MAELADALDLGSSEETHTGSIPASCTKMLKLPPKIGRLSTMIWRVLFYKRLLKFFLATKQFYLKVQKCLVRVNSLFIVFTYINLNTFKYNIRKLFILITISNTYIIFKY